MQLRPSSAHRWTRCAASPTFEAISRTVAPEEDNDAAREGTCAAWVADCVLKGDAANAAELDGETHANGWLVTPDMVEHVQTYCDMIKARGGVTTAEQFVRLTENIGGTLDCATSAENGWLLVDDFKYGFRIVEVWDNPQPLIYAGAEVLRLQDPTITHVRIGIYQPRAFHPEGIYRTQPMTIAELWEKLNWIVAQGNKCLLPNPPATPGPQCADCKAMIPCVANGFTNYQNFQIIEDIRYQHLDAKSAAAQWLFLESAEKLIKARKAALETEITERLKKEHFPGLYMKPRRGDRKFTVDPMTVHALTGVDPMKQVPMSPAQLEAAGAPVAIVKLIAKAPDIGHKLDRMPANYLEKSFPK